MRIEHQKFSIVSVSTKKLTLIFSGGGGAHKIAGPFKNFRHSDYIEKSSNLGEPGVWIFELKQDLSEPAIRGPPKEIATFRGNGGRLYPPSSPSTRFQGGASNYTLLGRSFSNGHFSATCWKIV